MDELCIFINKNKRLEKIKISNFSEAVFFSMRRQMSSYTDIGLMSEMSNVNVLYSYT